MKWQMLSLPCQPFVRALRNSPPFFPQVDTFSFVVVLLSSWIVNLSWQSLSGRCDLACLGRGSVFALLRERTFPAVFTVKATVPSKRNYRTLRCVWCVKVKVCQAVDFQEMQTTHLLAVYAIWHSVYLVINPTIPPGNLGRLFLNFLME